MGVDEGLLDWVREALEPMGAVTMRKMMGVGTLYLDGTIFAILDEEELWLKADAESSAAWDEAGCERFTFNTKDGRVESVNYRRAPTDVYDDPEAMRSWASLALEAGVRGAAKRRPKPQRKG